MIEHAPLVLIDADDDEVGRHRRVADGERAAHGVVRVVRFAGVEVDGEHERLGLLAGEEVAEQHLEDLDGALQHQPRHMRIYSLFRT